MSNKELTIEDALDLYFITLRTLRKVCEAYVKLAHPEITKPSEFNQEVNNVRRKFLKHTIADVTWLSEEMKDMVRHLELIE